MDNHFHFDRLPTCLIYARLSAREPMRCGSGHLCKAHKFKMEFDMLASTKQASIAIAAMLGVALSVPLSIPAFSASSDSGVDDDVDVRGPVVDFGLYYGPHIQLRHSKEGTARGTGKNTLYSVSHIE